MTGLKEKQRILREIAMGLNYALEADRGGINEFFSLQSMVNRNIALHSPIQVGPYEPNKDGYPMRMIGLLNGILGCDEKSGYIVAVMLGEGSLIDYFELVVL